MISIGLPVYKPDYLDKAIGSVLCQTYEDFELIIINDKSPYNVEKIINKYKDPRIRYYENKKNLGMEDLAAVWNQCLEHAKGDKFILFCDDDIYEKNFLEELNKLCNKYKKVNLFHSRVRIINEDDTIIKYAPSCPDYESGINFIWHKLCGFRLHFVPDFLCRTEALRSIGGFVSMPLAWGTDDLTWFKIAIDGGVAYTNKDLCNWRASSKNISSVGSTDKRILAINLYQKWLINFLRDYNPKNITDSILIEEIRLKQDHIIKDKKLYLIGLELNGYGMIKLHFKIIKLLIAAEYDFKSLFRLYVKRVFSILFK